MYKPNSLKSDPKPEKKEKKKKKRIRSLSVKREAENKIYLQKRKVFLEANTVCPVTGGRTTQIHHKKGRTGKLFLDIRFWLAVSAEGHKKIELNPEWAKEMGYSLNRL